MHTTTDPTSGQPDQTATPEPEHHTTAAVDTAAVDTAAVDTAAVDTVAAAVASAVAAAVAAAVDTAVAVAADTVADTVAAAAVAAAVAAAADTAADTVAAAVAAAVETAAVETAAVETAAVETAADTVADGAAAFAVADTGQDAPWRRVALLVFGYVTPDNDKACYAAEAALRAALRAAAWHGEHSVRLGRGRAATDHQVRFHHIMDLGAASVAGRPVPDRVLRWLGNN